MTKKEKIEEKTWELMTAEAEKLGLIPVDAEYLKDRDNYILRLTIDKEGGVGILDCEAMSRAIDPLLDEGDYIPDVYTLEVESPGLGRVLKRPRDFMFGMGKEVELKTYKAIDGKKEFTGILKQADKEAVVIENEDGDKTFNRSDISQIHLTFEL